MLRDTFHETRNTLHVSHFVHPLVDSGVAVKSRVIEVERSEANGIQIRAAEVL